MFDDVISAIDAGYDETEVGFEVNGVKSAPGKNLGSAKVFSLGILAGLSKEETLACFGQYYRDVVANPDGDDHPNIRAFMQVRANPVGVCQQRPQLTTRRCRRRAGVVSSSRGV